MSEGPQYTTVPKRKPAKFKKSQKHFQIKIDNFMNFNVVKSNPQNDLKKQIMFVTLNCHYKKKLNVEEKRN